jgi:hypothetical protein
MKLRVLNRFRDFRPGPVTGARRGAMVELYAARYACDPVKRPAGFRRLAAQLQRRHPRGGQ